MSINSALAFWKPIHVFFAFGNPLALITDAQRESYGHLPYFLTHGPPLRFSGIWEFKTWEEGILMLRISTAEINFSSRGSTLGDGLGI